MLILLTGVAISQTPSDDCSTAVAQQLPVGSSCTMQTWNISTAVGLPALTPCAGFIGTGADGWGWFTATAATTTISYYSTIDAQIYIYSGSCGALVLADCADVLFVGGTETVTIATTPGLNYFVRIVRYSGAAEMNGTVCVYSSSAPLNDTCENAVPIACGSVTNGTTVGATPETVPVGCYANNLSGSVWYTFTGNGQNILLSLCVGTTFDTQLSIFTGSCTALACYGFNDDGCGVQSQGLISSVPGVQYFVRVSGYGLASGPFQLSMTCTTPTVPNDGCGGAISLSCPQTVTGTTVGAAQDVIPAGCYINNTSPGVWYTFNGTGASTTASLCGSAYDTQISVLTGSCSGYSCVAYNDDFCGVQSQVTINTAVATVYYIYVSGFGSASGTFTLSLTCAAPPPPPCYIPTPTTCAFINTGPDISLPTCTDPCTPMDLTANFLPSGSTTSYTVCGVPYSPYPFNFGTGFSIGTDDLWTPAVNLPFPFCFYGTNYTQCVVGSNGLISFNTAYAGGYCPWAFTASCPSAALPLNSIFGVYHDIDPAVMCGTSPCGDARYATFGTTPCRRFVVSYDNVPLFSSVCNALKTSCEIVLHETTNIIEVFIENKPVCPSWNSGNSMIGIQNVSGTAGISPSGRNTGAWVAAVEGWRFTPSGASNVVVTWTSQSATLGTGGTLGICPTAPSTTFIASAVYTLCSGASLTLTDDVVVQCAMLVVPVEWLDFTALMSADEKTTLCHWSTASELNNDYFMVQRSADSETWSDIGFIDGNGTTTSERHYSFKDLQPLPGTSYYRIRQTDYNGTTDHSDIRSVKKTFGGTISAYPNPSTDILTLTPWKISNTVKMMESGGREVLIQCNDQGQINVRQLTSGTYILEVTDHESGEIQRLPVMVSN